MPSQAQQTKEYNLFQSAVTVSNVARSKGVPDTLLWGTILGLRNPHGSVQEVAERIATSMAAIHAKTGSWAQGVSSATHGQVTDAQATTLQKRIPLQHILARENLEGEFQDLWGAVTAIVAFPAILGGAVIGGGVVGGEAAAGGAEAAAGGAAAGEAGAAGAGGAAAGSAAGSAAAGGLTSALLKVGLVAVVVELVKAYGVRLLEVLGGGILVMFGLVTLARGGRPPSIPVPLPV